MRLLIFLICLWLCAGPAFADEAAPPAAAQGLNARQAKPTPPGQREAGPGGRDYAHDRVRIRSYGQDAQRVWVFSPVGAGDDALPVVLYVHGLNQLSYRGVYLWIEHLVRRGNIVIFPQYQTLGLIDPKTFTPATAKATRQALATCNGKDNPLADTQRFAMVGHSLGGTIILNLAARPKHFGLPTPKALMPLMPGDVRVPKGIGAFMPKITEDHSTVAADTVLLIVASTNDRIVGKRFAERIYKTTKRIDPADKDLLLLSDDDHGRPVLRAGHFVPTAYPGRVDAYDYALWRWFDALRDAAFEDGLHREITLGNTAQQRALGRWSDGKAIREPKVLDPTLKHGAGP